MYMWFIVTPLPIGSRRGAPSIIIALRIVIELTAKFGQRVAILVLIIAAILLEIAPLVPTIAILISGVIHLTFSPAPG